MTMNASTAATANTGESSPVSKAADTAQAHTNAEWELGIPPPVVR